MAYTYLPKCVRGMRNPTLKKRVTKIQTVKGTPNRESVPIARKEELETTKASPPLMMYAKPLTIESIASVAIKGLIRR